MPGLASDSSSSYDDQEQNGIVFSTTPNDNRASSSSSPDKTVPSNKSVPSSNKTVPSQNKTVPSSSDGGPTILNSVHRMASMFTSMQRNQQRHRPSVPNCDHGDESYPSQRHQDIFSGAAAVGTTPSNERNSRPTLRSRSTEASSHGGSSTTTTTTTTLVYCCDLKLLDNKSKFSSAKAVFESLERQSREQKRSSSSSASMSKLSPKNMFNNDQQKTTTIRVSSSSASPGGRQHHRVVTTSPSSCGSSPSSSTSTVVQASLSSSTASSTANNYSSSPVTIIKHQGHHQQQHQRSRLMADREREEWPANVNFNIKEKESVLSSSVGKVVHYGGPPPPPPVPPKPKVEVLFPSSSVGVGTFPSSSVGVGTLPSSSVGVGASSGLNYAFRSSSHQPKDIGDGSSKKGFNSSSACVKDLGVTSTAMTTTTTKEFNDSVTSVEQINDISSNLSTTTSSRDGLISTHRQILEDERNVGVSSSSTVNGHNNGSTATNSLLYGHHHQLTAQTNKDTRANVIGANNSKFLNSLSPSASRTPPSTSNVRKYPRLTETLSMENNNCKSSSNNADGSVVTLVGSPKQNINARTMSTGVSSTTTTTKNIQPKLDVNNCTTSVVDSTTKLTLDEKLNPSSYGLDCKMYTNVVDQPSTSGPGYEPYWRQTSWYSRRYNVNGGDNNICPTSGVDGIAMRNYSLRQNETPTTSKDHSSDDNNKSAFRGGTSSKDGTSQRSSVGGVGGDKTESPRLILNLFDNNDSAATLMSSSSVDYMTPQEASVLLSPATREEVLMHVSLKNSNENPLIVVGSTNGGADVKSLPSLIALPQDVDMKRLSVCSIDNSTTNEHGQNSSSSNADRFSMHDVSDVNYLTDGHFWIEIPGLGEEIFINSSSPNPSPHGSFRYKKPTKVTFSVKPIRVYSTHSSLEYDRRNEDVDPVSASAEYELERRLDKMDVFDVDVDKGTEGLGFSIIGMGVGADAGLEKLGIFVKSITPGGAVFRDGRIRVCDQIVEVDGKNLVGVSQSYAASVLRGTSGSVKFRIGREKDLDASEIAQLIRQSLEQDRLSLSRETEVLSRRGLNAEMKESSQQLLPPPRPAGWGPVRDSPLPSTDSVFAHDDETPEQLVDNPHIEHLMTQLRKQSNVEISSTNDDDNACRSTIFKTSLVKPSTAFQIDSSPSCGISDSQATLTTDINRLLNESLSDDRETHFPSNGAEPKTIPSIVPSTASVNSASSLRRRSPPQQDDSSQENEFINRRIGSLEVSLLDVKQEADKYQNLLLESQDQYVDLEKKYAKAKKLIRDYQEREKDLIEREEAHLRHLRDKDQQYSSLLKNLNEKVSELEKQLSDAHRKRASLAEQRSSSSNGSNTVIPMTDISPALAYLPSKRLENEQLLEKTSEPSTSTGIQKMSIKIVQRNAAVDENTVDFGVPDTQVLDSSFAKSKAEAVKQSVIMSARQLPSRHVDDEFFEVCQRRVKHSTDAATASTSTSTPTPTSTTATTATTPVVKMSPTKNINTNCATTSSGSPLTPRRLTQVLWMRKKASNASKDLEISVMKGCGDLDKIPEVFQWNCDDVCKFLKTLGLEKYSPEFSINRVDGCKLMQLDGAKLKSMGIQNHTDRALIKKRIKDMKCQIDKERKLLGKEYKKLLKLEKDKKKT